MSWPPELTSDRLRLRAPASRDASRIAELANDFDVTRMTGRMPHPYALEDAQAFLAAKADEDPAREATFIVEDRREGLVGVLGFFEDGGVGPEVGYWVGRPFWGRGYASEALGAALRWCDGEWKKRVVYAGHFEDNPASARVLEKAGFLYVGAKPLFSRARGELVLSRRMVRLA